MFQPLLLISMRYFGPSHQLVLKRAKPSKRYISKRWFNSWLGTHIIVDKVAKTKLTTALIAQILTVLLIAPIALTYALYSVAIPETGRD